MKRSLAGVYEPEGIRDPESAQRTILRGVPSATEPVLHLGALSVGFTGERPPDDGPYLCVADAQLYEPAETTTSDAPETLIVDSYRRGRVRGLAGLRGEFAAVIWDRERQGGLLCRDHFGSRPLFLAREGRLLLFASEIRELLAMLQRRPAPDRLAVMHWLALGWPPLGRTLYEGVNPLRAAHIHELRPGASAPQRYWAPTYRPPERRTIDEVDDLVRAHLSAAIDRRLPADGSVGIMIGGGVDAATVVALLRDRHPGLILRAYSAVFPQHRSVDESALIDRIAGQLSLPSTRVKVGTGSMLAGALAFQREWGVPLMSPNHGFMQPLVRRAAEDGVTVLLDGEGGDELFGMSPNLLADLLRHGRLMEAIRLAKRFPGAGAQPPLGQALRVVRFWGVTGAIPWRAHRALRLRRRGLPSLPEWLTPRDSRALVESYDDLAWKRARGPRWWASLAWTLTEGREQIGGQDYIRRRAAGTGLAPRHPLLDDVDLTETMLGIAPELAFDPDLNRPIARRLTAGLLPDPVRLRAEKTFWNEIFDDCMAHDRGAVLRLLADPRAELRAYTDPGSLERAARGEPPAGPAWAHEIWRAATAELWLRSEAEPDADARLGELVGAADTGVVAGWEPG